MSWPIIIVKLSSLSGPSSFLFSNYREHAANMYAATGEHTGFTPVASTAKFEGQIAEGLEPVPIINEPTSPLPAVNDVEVSPLLPQSPLLGQVEQLPVRPKGRFPLVRQQSAPPGSMLPPRASTPGAMAPIKSPRPVLDNVAELPEFPDVQLRKKSFMGRRSRPNSGESTNSGSLDPDATAQAFRKALRTTSSNQYKRVFEIRFGKKKIFLKWDSLTLRFLQVYQKHNRNLIGDDDMPDIEMVIRRRLSSVSTPYSASGRFPQAVSSVFNSPLSSPGTPTSLKSPSVATANPSTSSFDGGTYFPFTGNQHLQANQIVH